MVEQPQAREAHGYAVAVGDLNYVVVADGAARLGHIGHAGAVRALDVVAKGEERIGAQCHARLLCQPLALLVCVFDAFTVLIVAPYELVAANSASLTFGLDSMWQLILVAGLLVGVICGLILSAFRGRAFDVLLALALAVGIGSYVQTLFLNGSLTVADGNLIDWSKYTREMVGNLLIWAAIVAALVTLAAMRERAGRVVAAVSSVVLVLGPAGGSGEPVGFASGWLEHPDSEDLHHRAGHV